MTEKATVLKNNGVTALLGCTIDSETCKSCAGSPFCNVKERTYEATIGTGLSISPGDVVRVYLPPGRTILAGFMVLIMPLLFFFLFYFAAARLFSISGEGGKAIVGTGGLLLGFLISFLSSRRNKKKNMPKIIGKAEY